MLTIFHGIRRVSTVILLLIVLGAFAMPALAKQEVVGCRVGSTSHEFMCCNFVGGNRQDEGLYYLRKKDSNDRCERGRSNYYKSAKGCSPYATKLLHPIQLKIGDEEVEAKRIAQLCHIQFKRCMTTCRYNPGRLTTEDCFDAHDLLGNYDLRSHQESYVRCVKHNNCISDACRIHRSPLKAWGL